MYRNSRHAMPCTVAACRWHLGLRIIALKAANACTAVLKEDSCDKIIRGHNLVAGLKADNIAVSLVLPGTQLPSVFRVTI